jgi:GntR family transcriptional regulator, transcriptional repressor for pyruvate dehydrogenase complex
MSERTPLGRAERPRSPKASELIARDLAAHIVDENLEEGAMLPTEREMVETLGVGRTTLREALRLLETRGVLTIRPGPRGGPAVRHPRPADLGAALTLILQFEQASLADVMEAREALRPMVARLAALRIDEATVDELRESVARMIEHEDDQNFFFEENARFHTLIAEASGSVVLRVFSESLKSIADGLFAGVRYNVKRRRAIARAHERIVDALASHDPDAASEAMHRHLVAARRYWETEYPELVTQPVRWLT